VNRSREVELLRSYDTKEQAEDAVHFWAEVVRNMGRSDSHGARVKHKPYVGWGVWLMEYQ
jgi:hypothetical protein